MITGHVVAITPYAKLVTLSGRPMGLSLYLGTVVEVDTRIRGENPARLVLDMQGRIVDGEAIAARQEGIHIGDRIFLAYEPLS